jgi:hypothetical protein
LFALYFLYLLVPSAHKSVSGFQAS